MRVEVAAVNEPFEFSTEPYLSDEDMLEDEDDFMEEDDDVE